MALTTDLRRFVAYVPTRPATTFMIQGGAVGGGAKVASSPPAQSPGRSGVAGGSGAGQGSPGVEDTRGIETTETVPAEAPHANADVLVVDDDADVRWTVAEILRSAGLSVAEAEDGEIALDLLHSGTYRMILLDLRMPRRDGVSLIEELGDVPPVIVHSAYSVDVGDRERLGSSVVDYLHKPVSPQKLLRSVEAALGSAR
jgi:two-component system chemotaxis response regulator CheY